MIHSPYGPKGVIWAEATASPPKFWVLSTSPSWVRKATQFLALWFFQLIGLVFFCHNFNNSYKKIQTI